MITTPEQMREAAIDACKKVADEAKSYGIPQMAMGANTCYDAIRAIPIAPTMAHDMIAKDRADWLLDAIACATQNRQFLRGDPEYDKVSGEAILLNGEKAISIAISRAIHPAAPLSDPRVKALVKALKRWRYDGCPNCLGDCSGATPPVTSCIMQETRAALRAIGGEA